MMAHLQLGVLAYATIGVGIDQAGGRKLVARRREAHIPAALWSDPEFRVLDRYTQRLYLMLLTAPEMDQAGVLPLVERRWAGRAANLTPENVLQALGDLHTAGMVFADMEQQEVFVSGYYVIERIAKQPRRVVGVIDTLNESFSAELRSFASAELGSLLNSVAPDVPRGDRAAVLERDGWRCRRCRWRPGDPVPEKRGRPLYRALEIDHIHPKSKGGRDEIANYQVLCASCNASKGARLLVIPQAVAEGEG
jgi:HNH endonuclease